MLNSRPDPVVSTVDPGPREDFLGAPIRGLDFLQDEIRAHGLQLHRDLRAREIAGHQAFELVPSVAAQGEDEQLLGNGPGVRRNDVRFAPAVVQLAMDALHVVGDRRHLANVRSAPQLLLQLVHPRQHLRTLQRVGRPLEHQLIAVDARQLAVDDRCRLPQRMVAAEEVDVVRVDVEPEDAEGEKEAHRDGGRQHAAGVPGRPFRDALERRKQVALVGRFTGLRLDQAEQRGHEHE